jgi:thymidine kinase
MSIELWLGPMFGGKTTELFRIKERVECAGKQTVLYKYDKDTRYTSRAMAMTHSRDGREAISLATFHGFEPSYGADVVIFIDEGQFYADSVPEFAERMSKRGNRVIIAALSGDFKRQPWPAVSRLVALADSIEFLTAVCYGCKSEGAAFTRRITADQETLEVIGGADKYHAACRKCHETK